MIRMWCDKCKEETPKSYRGVQYLNYQSRTTIEIKKIENAPDSEQVLCAQCATSIFLQEVIWFAIRNGVNPQQCLPSRERVEEMVRQASHLHLSTIHPDLQHLVEPERMTTEDTEPVGAV